MSEWQRQWLLSVLWHFLKNKYCQININYNKDISDLLVSVLLITDSIET